MFKRFLGLGLIYIMLLGLIPSGVNVFAEIISGECGDGVFWIMDEYGVLDVFGDGKIYDYDSPEETPFYEYKDKVTKIIIEDDVTSNRKVCICRSLESKTDIYWKRSKGTWCGNVRKCM